MSTDWPDCKSFILLASDSVARLKHRHTLRHSVAANEFLKTVSRVLVKGPAKINEVQLKLRGPMFIKGSLVRYVCRYIGQDSTEMYWLRVCR